jgi:DNA-binding response OmpR family regulator
MSNILLLEDDFKMASELKLFLNNHGYGCEVVHDGGVFLRQLEHAKYDCYILDVNVPTINGMEVCKRIREKDSKVPILMLTAYSAVEDKVQALEYGADDYLVKPFHSEELLARIKALLRRSGNPQQESATMHMIADLLINATDMTVIRAGKEIALTPKEYKLLELLASAKGRTVSKQTIAEQVWDLNFATGTNTIEVYINFLRNKIDKGHNIALIHTRPGYGYYLKEGK